MDSEQENRIDNHICRMEETGLFKIARDKSPSGTRSMADYVKDGTSNFHRGINPPQMLIKDEEEDSDSVHP